MTGALCMLNGVENMLAADGTTPPGTERKFVPREDSVTGRTDVRDIGIDKIDGVRAQVFVDQLFSCLATVGDRANFRPLSRRRS